MKITEPQVELDEMHIAYFSMEIAADSKIPTYAGGLGVLAGDTLRSAVDLELPVIGITLLYRKGYFRQRLDHGNQVERDVNWNPSVYLTELPNKIKINIEGRDVAVKAWMYKMIGVTGEANPVIFLDTDLPENDAQDRQINYHLYGKDQKYRLMQEIVLGIGGVRMLESIGCHNIEKYHMNEGHSALLTLELLRRSQAKDKIDDVRHHCVFTTHTPVPAGHDQFPKDLAQTLLGDFLKVTKDENIYHDNKLNMTYLGLRFSKFINGVAKKHGEVSRSMFPGYHIESITNGVHSSFWTSPAFRELFDRYIPSWRSDPFSLRYVLSIPKEEIWEAHRKAKQALLELLSKKYKVEFDPEMFTIGFARRAATYKRGDMLFSDIKRLLKIAKKEKGLQIVYAGKAHPKDGAGKDIIKKIVSAMESVKDKINVCYVEDYDMEIAKVMVAGVDIWLNTPQRPQEASGTSGMKAAHNGVPHFSTLDGWWLEGHIENITGWSIGIHPDIKDDIHEEDSEDLYTKLEYVILPKFYGERDSWIEVMRHSIAMNGSFFNTHRMVEQYVSNAYFE